MMHEIEMYVVDSASAGSIGDPGSRTFLIQGRKDDQVVSVLVEKQQVELLATQSIEFLDSIKTDYPEEKVATPEQFDSAGEITHADPLFRANAIGLIFDPSNQLVTLELREKPVEEDLDDEQMDDEYVVRLTMTRSQLRAMAVKGNQAVMAGRELCPLCQNPMNTSGHVCPRLN
ncbi:MAG: DUF3090 family protein [Acidimicrobiia bacterium]